MVLRATRTASNGAGEPTAAVRKPPAMIATYDHDAPIRADHQLVGPGGKVLALEQIILNERDAVTCEQRQHGHSHLRRYDRIHVPDDVEQHLNENQTTRTFPSFRHYEISSQVSSSTGAESRFLLLKLTDFQPNIALSWPMKKT